MKKALIIATLTVMGLTATFLSARPKEVAAENCEKRIQAFLQILKTNKEVQFVFNASVYQALEALKAKDPAITPKDVLRGLADAMRDACYKDERSKEDA